MFIEDHAEPVEEVLSVSHNSKMKLDGHPLSNLEIESIIKKHFGSKASLFGGVYAQGQLPHPFASKFYILNLDRPDGPGTHWILVNGTIPKSVYYFDPFGGPVLPRVLKWVPKDDHVFYTDDVLQNMYSDMCGYYCIYIAYEMVVKGRDIDDIIMKDFTNDERRNDQVVMDLFRKGVL